MAMPAPEKVSSKRPPNAIPCITVTASRKVISMRRLRAGLFARKMTRWQSAVDIETRLYDFVLQLCAARPTVWQQGGDGNINARSLRTLGGNKRWNLRYGRREGMTLPRSLKSTIKASRTGSRPLKPSLGQWRISCHGSTRPTLSSLLCILPERLPATLSHILTPIAVAIAGWGSSRFMSEGIIAAKA